MHAETELIKVRVKSISYEAENICLVDLRPLTENGLPSCSPGAHIDLHLPNGLIRSYSLCNAQNEPYRYVIGVNRDPEGRGGSRFIHDALRPGAVLTISAPRNNFPLVEDAGHSVLIAGGIGITPVWCMIQHLEGLGRSWELFYSTRTRGNTAFLDDLRQFGRRVHLNHTQEPGGGILDFNDLLSRVPPGTHLYCCGPVAMLEAFESAAASLPSELVHVEYFGANKAPATDGGFDVMLSRSGRVVFVPEGKTILDTLLDEGIDAPHSCGQGVCGTCETRVLEGTPDHRDLVLSKQEQASNKTMMICCSGCKGDKLILDL